jgi:FMN phosphatase YigB (HAD superfamily)
MAGQATRLSWLGLSPEDFDLVTCYTSDKFCKPNPAYFHDVCQRMDIDPAKCLMIGNDDREDMHCAAAAGMDAYLVTDCRLIDKDHPWQGAQGTFAEMVEMLKRL